MKTSLFYYKLSLQIIVLFGIIIFASFIPDNFHIFFGDTYCLGNLNHAICSDGWGDTHGKTWHWGYRHFMWMIMGTCLFIIQGIRIWNSILESDFIEK